MSEILEKLRLPFHPSHISWKPGAVKGDRALAMAYADLRAYMHRLDEVCGEAWEVNYEPWGIDRIICRLTISGVTRSSIGESDKDADKNEIGGTVAEAQSFKRACAMFGLGRYLYNLPTGWAEYDPAKRQFTEGAKAKLNATLMQHYRRAMDGAQSAPRQTQQEQDDSQSTLLEEFDTLGRGIYGDMWEQVSRRNVDRISGGMTEDASGLTFDQLQKLIAGMKKVSAKQQAATQNADVEFGQAKLQNAPRSPQDAQERVGGNSAHDNPFDDAAPYFVSVWHKLTGKEYDFVNWIQALHRKDEPATDKQYQFLTGIIDELTNKQHGYALSILCQSEISGANKPSRMAAKALLRHLQKEIKAEDENGNEIKDDKGKSVKVANPDFRQDFAEIVTMLAKTQEPEIIAK